MGCDIHLFVERKEEGVWVSADKWSPPEYDDDDREREVLHADEFYHGRNYDLFALLAGVRNYNDITPISGPRGMPDDVSPGVRAEYERWDSDAHTPSHYTLAELLAFDWTQTFTARGVVSALEYEKWKGWAWGPECGPGSYCGGISGPRVRMVNEADMQAAIAGITERVRKETPCGWGPPLKAAIKKELADTYCDATWDIAFHRECKDFWGETIPRLLALGAPENVRIVFWFDN